MARTPSVWLGGLLLSLLGACGSTADEQTPDTFATDLQSIQTEIFTPGCALSGCHSADSQSGQLDLSSADASFAALVDVGAANAVASENRWVRVKPMEPELSFLIRKLDQPGVGEGGPMPSATQVLSAPYREMIVRWIEEGAPR